MYHRRRTACGHRRRTCSVLCPRRRSGVVFRDNGGLRPVVRHGIAVRPPPYIVLTEYGITEPFAIREQIEWDAVLYADDFYFRGQYWVRLLLGRDYKPQLIRPAWFWRFDRLYESKGVKAVYIRTMGLEVDSMRLAALIRRMKEADMSERIGLLREFRSE